MLLSGDDEHFRRILLAQYVKRFGVSPEQAPRSWCPHYPHPKQKEFLSLTCREALYGGAAGGGKTDCLLMVALLWVEFGEYSALILRRTYADLAMSDAIMDRSKQWLLGSGARWNETEKKWTFPSGATIKFGHLDNDGDLDQFQGAAFHGIFFDELTQFTERQYRYLLSRNRRRAGCTIPLRIRATANPGGRGHLWVYKRFVESRPNKHDQLFIPAKLEDNPSLDGTEYRPNLEQLDSITRAQLLDGLWIQDTTGLIYPYDDSINGVDEEPNKDLIKILAIDFGASIQKATTAFAVTAFSPHDPYNVWGIESYAESGMIPSTIAEEIRTIKDRHDITKVVADAGALGVGYIEELKKRHHMWIEPAKKADKRGYRKLMRGDLERGAFKVLRETNSALIEEYQSLCWDEHGLDTAKGAEDHLSDAMLYAWREARYYQSKEVPIVPRPGTPERYEWEESKILKYMDDQGRQKKRGGFKYDDI